LDDSPRATTGPVVSQTSCTHGDLRPRDKNSQIGRITRWNAAERALRADRTECVDSASPLPPAPFLLLLRPISKTHAISRAQLARFVYDLEFRKSRQARAGVRRDKRRRRRRGEGTWRGSAEVRSGGTSRFVGYRSDDQVIV